MFSEIFPDSLLYYENILESKGYQKIAGLDEAGRGALAGPVVAAAVIFPSGLVIKGINDSKQLSANQREYYLTIIKEKASAIGIGLASPQEIDKINILQATKLAMGRAISKLRILPDFLLLDAVRLESRMTPQMAIIKGDQKSQSIAAASIVAKVIRDRIMVAMNRRYPEYEFHRHKGYGTKHHLLAIRRFGPVAIHRKTFKGVYDFRFLFDIEEI